MKYSTKYCSVFYVSNVALYASYHQNEDSENPDCGALTLSQNYSEARHVGKQSPQRAEHCLLISMLRKWTSVYCITLTMSLLVANPIKKTNLKPS